MNDKTRANLETISVATVSMQLLKRGIRNVSMVGPKPLNTPMMPIVGEALYVALHSHARGFIDA